MTQKNKRYLPLLLATAAFLGLHLLCNWLPRRADGWGVFHLSYFDWRTQALFFVCSALILALNERISSFLMRIPGWALPIFFIAAFMFFPSSHTLWGDGYMMAGLCRGPLLTSHMEFGDLLVHRLIYRLLTRAGLTVTGFEVYRWASITAGAAAIMLMLYWAKRHLASNGSRTLLILLFFTQGSAMLFYGHPESYSLFYVSVLWFFLSALGALDDGGMYLPAAAVLLSAFLHLAGVALIPLLAAVWLVSRPGFKIKPAFAYCFMVLLAAGLVGAAVVLRRIGSGYFLPLWPEAARPYAFFSPKHLADLLNMAALLSPLPLLLLLILPRLNITDKRVFFLSGSALFLMLGMGLFDPVLEAADWDLMSFALIPMFLLAFEKVRVHWPEKRMGLIAGLCLAVMVAHTWPWLISNARPGLIVRQYAGIAARYGHLDRSRLFARATMNLSGQPGKSNEAAVYMAGEAIRNGLDDQRIWNNLGLAYFNLNKYDSSATAYNEVVKRDPGNVNAWGMLGNIHLRRGAFGPASQAFRQVARYRPDDPGSWSQLAGALMDNGSVEEAVRISRNALSKWPEDGRLWAAYAAGLLQSGEPEAVNAAIKALKFLPGDPSSYINAGIAYAMEGRSGTAREVWSKGASAFPANQKLQILSNFSDQEIRQEFTKKQ